MTKFVDQQQKYLEAIEWLVSGSLNTGTGRTHLLAQAFLNVSIKRPGLFISVFDHVPTLRCTKEILGREIQLVARKLYPIHKFTFKVESVRFDGLQD